jgi:hypothetical protein
MSSPLTEATTIFVPVEYSLTPNKANGTIIKAIIVLRAVIQSDDGFKEEGKFSIEKYKRLLRTNNYSTIDYEQLKSKELTQNQIKYNFLRSAFLTPLMLNRMQSLNDQQRKFSYIRNVFTVN